MHGPQDNSWIEQSQRTMGSRADDGNADDSSATADGDNAGLLETWTAFTGLLDKSQRAWEGPPLDESSLVSAVLARTAHRERVRRRFTIGAIGLAMAATLLVAVSLARMSREEGNVAIAPHDDPVKDTTVATARKEVVLPDWGDRELIESLDKARQEFEQLETNWRQKSDPMADFQNRLDALQQEMENSSL